MLHRAGFDRPLGTIDRHEFHVIANRADLNAGITRSGDGIGFSSG
ncbi:MAG TPA: hypothetical protein VFW44_11080 [Bryobacteraceae bacterium]|nr:hypothetical protein [Bryobacteraceae bacterium]